MLILLLFLSLSFARIKVYPTCKCLFGLGRDIDVNDLDAVGRFKECICKYILTQEAVKKRDERQTAILRDGALRDASEIFIGYDPMYASKDEIMVNPEY